MKAEDNMNVISQVQSTLKTTTTFCYCKSMHAHTCHGPLSRSAWGGQFFPSTTRIPGTEQCWQSLVASILTHWTILLVRPTPSLLFLFLFPSLFLCPVFLLDMVSHYPGTHVVCSTRLPVSTRDLPSVSHSYWCAWQSLSSLELGRMWMGECGWRTAKTRTLGNVDTFRVFKVLMVYRDGMWQCGFWREGNNLPPFQRLLCLWWKLVVPAIN